MIPYSEWTKEEFIEEHRKMWNWIADKIEKEEGSCEEILDYKKQYFFWHPELTVDLTRLPLDYCFACEYSNAGRRIPARNPDCDMCLFAWDSGRCYREDGEYTRCNRALICGNREKAAKVAREIANLPIREEM